MKKRNTKKLFLNTCLILLVMVLTLAVACSEPAAPATPAAPTTPAAPPSAPAPPPSAPAAPPSAPAPPPAAPSAPAKAVNLVANNPTVPGNPMETVLLLWGKDFEKNTGGRYTVEVVSGDALAGMPVAYDALADGIADVCIFQPPMVEKPFPLTELPVLFWGPVSCEIMTKAWIKDVYKKGYLDDELSEIKVLTPFIGPVGDIETAAEISSLADLEGLKLGNAQGPICVELMNRLGVVSVFGGPPDMYPMLQKGIVDGLFGSLPMVPEFHLEEFVSYMLPIQISHMSHVIGMNQDVYNKMPDDVKKIVDEMWEDETYTLSAPIGFDVWYQDAVVYFEEVGGVEIDWSAEDMATLNEIAGTIWEEEMVRLESTGKPAREVCDALYNSIAALGADPAEIAFGYAPGN